MGQNKNIFKEICNFICTYSKKKSENHLRLGKTISTLPKSIDNGATPSNSCPTGQAFFNFFFVHISLVVSYLLLMKPAFLNNNTSTIFYTVSMECS